jgi:hypothetical protein
MREGLVAKGTIPRVLRQPWRLPRALSAILALAPTGWWRRRPFLPYPDPAYWRFRMETSSGGEGGEPPSPDEVIEVLDWFHRMKHRRR